MSTHKHYGRNCEDNKDGRLIRGDSSIFDSRKSLFEVQ